MPSAIAAKAAVFHDFQFIFYPPTTAETIGGIGQAIFMKTAGNQHTANHRQHYGNGAWQYAGGQQ